jgi:hypothetical protein
MFSSFFLFSQIPGTDAVLRSAESSGWTAVLICAMFMFLLGGGAWLIKTMFREKGELGKRLTSVEDFQRKKMLRLHVNTFRACNRAAEACEQSNRVIAEIGQVLQTGHCPLQNGELKKPGA